MTHGFGMVGQDRKNVNTWTSEKADAGKGGCCGICTHLINEFVKVHFKG